ncbi:MAG: hypothetical protein J3T61_00800, partial [Candidatus Brocadiales bacterium]|nr:hypothetical protein [Candidatus Bathyanammoxibius sp.]
YGIDGAVDTTASLGDYLSGQKTLSFPAGSGVEGVAAKKIGHRLKLDRSTTNTNTPKLQEFEVQAQHVLLDKLAWNFVIDIEKSRRANPVTPVTGTMPSETIITNLETVTKSKTLVTFTWGGMTQTRVRVPNDTPPVFDLESLNDRHQALGYRTGKVTMRVEEGR